MRRSVIEVRDMLSVLSVDELERRIGKAPGVKSVTVNFAAGSATVRYDETRLEISDIKSAVRRSGRESDVPAPGPPEHDGHKAGAMSPDKAEIAQEMGHGAGDDMDAMARDMRNRLVVTFVLTVLIYLYAPMFVKMTGLRLPVPFGLSNDVWMFLFATPAVFYGGWVFYIGAWRALGKGIANMSVLVSLSVLAGYSFSVGATFFFKAEVFYEAIAMLLVFILTGHWLEMRARSGASKAVTALLNLTPPKATVMRNGQPVEVPTSEVAALSMSGSTLIVVGDALLLKRVKMNAQLAPESTARA